jgi:hypothetical protein
VAWAGYPVSGRVRFWRLVQVPLWSAVVLIDWWVDPLPGCASNDPAFD